MTHGSGERRRTLEVDVQSAQRPTHAILTSVSSVDTGRMIVLRADQMTTLGRSEDCTHTFPDVSVSGLHARLAIVGGSYALADAGSTNGTFVNDERVSAPRPLRNGDVVRLGPRITLRFQLMADDEREALGRMYEAAVYDRLTQLYNRNHVEDRLDAELAFALRHKAELSIALVDIDHFKLVNDTHGHPAGDAVLKAVARTLGAAVRTEDLVARYGGEEFIVIMRGIPLSGAVIAAERIRQTILSSDVPWVAPDETTGAPVQSTLRVTVSVGVASLTDTGATDKVELLKCADRRLYRAKTEGRNRTVGQD